MSFPGFKLVEAYRARNPAQAHALKFALEDAGIHVVIENEPLQDAIGEIPGGWASCPRLLVAESQLATARDLLRRTDHHANTPLELTPAELAGIPLACLGIGLGKLKDRDLGEPTRCLACNAIMAESESTCPNCGWTYEASSSETTK